MKVNFIYTYSVDMEREQEGFFIVTPPQVNAVLTGIADLAALTSNMYFLYKRAAH